MKSFQYLLIPALATGVIVMIAFSEEERQNSGFGPMADPRPPIYRTFSVGEKSQQTLSECILVIAWSHPPKGSEQTGYQIWGDQRILTREQLSASLSALCQTTEDWKYQPHLLVIGNQWGAGRELDPIMKKLSRTHQIDTYYFGKSYLFREVAFDIETEERSRAITEAVNTGVKRHSNDN